MYLAWQGLNSLSIVCLLTKTALKVVFAFGVVAKPRSDLAYHITLVDTFQKGLSVGKANKKSQKFSSL